MFSSLATKKLFWVIPVKAVMASFFSVRLTGKQEKVLMGSLLPVHSDTGKFKHKILRFFWSRLEE